MHYNCKNYRPNKSGITLPGACFGHQGQIIADLYDQEGKFHRSAVVADLGKVGSGFAQKYCDERNAAEKSI